MKDECREWRTNVGNEGRMRGMKDERGGGGRMRGNEGRKRGNEGRMRGNEGRMRECWNRERMK